ncbi:MAG: citrate/2-methylcitrate synthase, partial [Spirochaetaceae bacterium]|nr:citrate/2-methylcitrate synthase [Spirochaetaceae bacterium]
KYNCKRGLRNEDGTGVLVGLTEIGEVHGYIIDDAERIPAPGKLSYRGMDLSDIVHGFQADNRFGFEEVTYLLLFGVLPTGDELAAFSELLGNKRELPKGFTEDMVLRAPSVDIMNKLARSVLVSYSYDPNAEELSVRNILRQSIELIARFPSIVAYAYQAKRHYFHEESLYIHAPEPELSTAANFLQMMRPDRVYTPLEAEILDLALVLHAEHGGGNNSTFTIQVVSSAATDTYSAVAAAVGSLKGAKHGGANNRVMSMMADIKKNVGDWTDEGEVQRYVEEIIGKEVHDRSGLVYGMGHAVYTLSDPRAVLLKEKAGELAAEKGSEEEFGLYETVEKVTPQAFSAVRGYERVIAPNVDFFSGFVYSMLNIAPELYTPIFAMSRVAGWCAHRLEEVVSGSRIIRPAYKCVVPRSPYTSLGDRASTAGADGE